MGANFANSSKFIYSFILFLYIGLSNSFIVSFENVTQHRISKRMINDITCGQNENSVSLISGGDTFPRGEWPYTLALFYVGDKGAEFMCGGTIISKTTMLTGKSFISS